MKKNFLGFLGLMLVTSAAQAEIVRTDVAYSCADAEEGSGYVAVDFRAREIWVDACGNPNQDACRWIARRSGTAIMKVIGSESARYSFCGVSSNPSLNGEFIAYTFRRRGESLAVYVRLGNPDRSYYTVANSSGLIERRNVRCEIRH